MTIDTTKPFDTGYIGAHRWHVEGSYRWTCVCGSSGSAAGNLAFMYECFGRHAMEKTEDAAIALVLEPLPHTQTVYENLLKRAKEAQEAGDRDRGNILMRAANIRYHEAQEALRQDYEALRWTSWPEATSEGRAVEVERGYDSYWLHVAPDGDSWSWETWLINTRTGDETKLTGGRSLNRLEAQEDAWKALVLEAYQDDQGEEDPF